MLGLASRTDLTDTQCGSVVRALEPASRARRRPEGTARPRHRPPRESEWRDVPREHPYRLCSSHGTVKQHFVFNSALLTTWATLKAEIDNVRRAQAAASSTPQPMDLSASGGKSRGKGKGKGKDRSKLKDSVPTTPCPICGKAGHWKKDCWFNIPNGWEETNKSKDKSKGKDGKDKTPANNQQQSNKDKCEVLELQRYGTLFQRLSEEEAELCRLWKVRSNDHPLVRLARRR